MKSANAVYRPEWLLLNFRVATIQLEPVEAVLHGRHKRAFPGERYRDVVRSWNHLPVASGMSFIARQFRPLIGGRVPLRR
jgi:hypothetical protein